LQLVKRRVSKSFNDLIIKETLLEEMKKPENYRGPEVEIVVKDSKADNLVEIIDNLLNKIDGKNIAMF
jgi:hypothetical protein